VTTGNAGITVGGNATSVLSGGVNGTGGITVNTTGFVTVAGSNSYSGNTVINAGTFFTNSASALGDTTGTTTVNSPGSLFVVQGNTDYGAEVLTINGTGTANNGALHAGNTTSTFENTVSLGSDSLINVDGGSTLALTAATNGTALNGNNHQLSLAGTGTISIGGNVTNVTVISSTGTTIAFAPAASATLTISTPISGTGVIAANTGGTPVQGSLGTTALTANNSSFTGNVTVGSGNLLVTNPNQIGSGTGTITLSGGAAPAVNGTLLTNSGGTMTITNPIVIGGRQGVNVTPVLVPYIENVSGNTTFTGAVTMNSGGAEYPLQSDAGTLTIQGNININSGDLVTGNFTGRRGFDLQGAGNGVLNGVFTDSATLPIFITKSGSGTWTLGATSSLNGDLTLNDTGTLAVSGAHNETFAGVLNVNSGTPHLDFGAGASTIRLANSSAQAWAGTSLGVSNWTYGTDHFQVGTDNTGLTGGQLSQINFDHFVETGATIRTIGGFGEVLPNAVGDVNQDGVRDIADVSAEMTGLRNIQAYQAVLAGAHPGFTLSDTNFVLDVNLSGSPNNLDVQAELVGLANGGVFAPGGGSLTAVPEPASCLLLALGGALLLAARKRTKLLVRQRNSDAEPGWISSPSTQSGLGELLYP
jgi:autotransporter-associated beta strand protein